MSLSFFDMALLRRLYLRRNIFIDFMRMSYGNGRNVSTGSAASCQKALEDLKTNPYFDKYADKIAQLQQESPETLRERLEENEKKKKKKSGDGGRQAKERPYTAATDRAKPQLDASPFTRTKTLDEVMKTDLLEDKTGDEIRQLWLDYHRDKDVVVGVVPKDTYEVMHERGREFATFLLPMPRSQGYEFIMCQFVAHEVHFTPLIAYQTHKENAPECLTLTFYPDLQDKKGIVLMKGEFDTDILNCQEAQCLVNELQLYYAQNNEKRLNLLKRFTYSPNEFNHMDLIAELECLSL